MSADLGLGGLFAISFLASTLLPLGSEWLLVVLLTQHRDPLLLVLIATAGNTGGAATTYLIGRWGSRWIVRRWLRLDAASQQRAEVLFSRYGRWSLLFSWLPIVGDPLCLAAGLLRAPALSSLILIATGKLVRYALVAWLTLQTLAIGAG